MAKNAIGVCYISIVVIWAVRNASLIFIEKIGMAGVTFAGPHAEAVAWKKTLTVGGGIIKEICQSRRSSEVDVSSSDTEKGVSVKILSLKVGDGCACCVDGISITLLIVYNHIEVDCIAILEES